MMIMIGRLARLLWPALLALGAVFYGATFLTSSPAHWIFIAISVLLFLVQAKMLGVLTASKHYSHKKVLGNDDEDLRQLRVFDALITGRMNNRLLAYYNTYHSESNKLISHILPIVTQRNSRSNTRRPVALNMLTSLSENEILKELSCLQETEKTLVRDAVAKDYISINFLPGDANRPEEHFSVIDGRDVLVQEMHVHDPHSHTPTDVMYAENAPLAAARFNKRFYSKMQSATSLASDRIYRALAAPCEPVEGVRVD